MVEYFLSNCNLHEYFVQDKEFTKLLTHFSSKQFEAQKNIQETEINEIVHATKSLSLTEQQDYSIELERLKTAFYISEQQYLASVMELSKATSRLMKLKHQDGLDVELHNYESLWFVSIELFFKCHVL